MIGRIDNPRSEGPYGFGAARPVVFSGVAIAPARSPATPLAQKLPPGTHLQYMGFDQTGSLREYRFRQISRGEKTLEFIVKAELGLFIKHHVGMQEGPAMCLHLLSGRSDASGAPARAAADSLTDTDMLAHLASRPAKRGAKSPSRFSSATSDGK